jgi:hypothetical protein
MSRPRKVPEPEVRAEDFEQRSSLEIAEAAIVRAIEEDPQPEILTPLVNALSKLLAVKNKINEGDTYMKGFEEDDPPPKPPVPT